MNKLVITILIGIGLFSMFINKNLCTYNKTYRVNVIKIKKVDFNILTFAAVKCIDFDTYFNFPKEIIIKDKTLIEFKLAKNSQLKKNMKSQLNVYKSANETNKGITIIVFFTKEEEARMENILVQLKIENSRHIIRIDARKDNKKSASKV